MQVGDRLFVQRFNRVGYASQMFDIGLAGFVLLAAMGLLSYLRCLMKHEVFPISSQ
jgi:hypothetical protein